MVPTQVGSKNPSPNLMAKAKPVYVANESPVIPVGNEEHYFRVADLQKTWRRPPEQLPAEIFPQFREEDGNKAKFPTIKYFANRKEVSELATSKPGHPDSGKWAIDVFARAFQKPRTTISKYARTDPYNKPSMNRERVLPRRTR